MTNNDFDYDEDRKLDARRETWDDDHPPDMQCDDCGFEWWGDWTRGSRFQPPEPRIPDCPQCNAT